MRRRTKLAPSRLGGLTDLHFFDQENGVVAAPEEGRYREAEHTAAPEQVPSVSFGFLQS